MAVTSSDGQRTRSVGPGRAARVGALSLLLGLILLFLGGATADAHALLQASDPRPGAVLPSDRVPGQISLTFSEPVQVAFNGVAVLDGDGRRLDRLNARVMPSDPQRVEVDVGELPEGAYVVRWQAVSADSHVVRGTYWFGIGFASAPPPGAVFSSGAPSLIPLEVLARWLGVVAGLTLAGAPLFHSLVIRPVQARLGRRVIEGQARLWLAAAAAFVLAQLLLAAAQAEAVAGLPLPRAIDGTVLELVLGGSRFAVLWWTRLVLGLVLTSLLVQRARGSTPVALLLLVATSLAGHASGARTLGPLALAADALHLAAASLWLGGLVQLAVLLPGLLASVGEAERARLLRVLVRRVSTVALASVLVLLATGTFATWEQVASIEAFVSTAYGQSLALKLVLLIPLLAIAAINLLVVRPHAARGVAHPRLADQFHLLVVAETALGVCVLLPVALLAGLPPPAEQPLPAPFEATRPASDLRLSLLLEPDWIGVSTARVRLADAQGSPPADVENVLLTFAMEGMNMGRTTVPAMPRGNGEYVAQGFYNGMPGIAQVGVAVSRSGGSDVSTVFEVDVPDLDQKQVGGLRAVLGAGPLGLLGLVLGVLGALTLGVAGLKLTGRPLVVIRGAAVVVVLAGGGAFMVERRLADALTPELSDTLAATGPANARRGSAVYAAQCVACHGETGVGNGPAAASLRPPPSDLTLHARWHPDEQLYWFVSHGVTGTAMPAFGDRLSPNDRRDVIAYLHELASAPTATPQQAGLPVQAAPTAVAGAVAIPARDTNGVAGRLVFGPDNDSDLWLLVLPDGKPQRITKLGPGEFSSSPAWSADGSQIAYTYYKLPTGTRFPVPDGTDLYVVNADGTGGRLVAEHQVRGAALQNPAWSGDGSAIYVAYMARLPTGGVDAGIDRVAVASGARTRVVPGAAFPSLSRDGQRLAYVRLAAGDVRGETLWWSAADGGHPQQILGPDVFVKLSAVRLAPDGQRLVFAAIGDGATYREPDGSAGALAPLGWIGRLLGGPIAYADGEQWDLWTIDIRGRNLRRLTRLGEDLPVAAWAPDGQSIAFLGGGSAVTAQTGVAIVDADGRRDPQRVTSQPGHRGLDWAPPPGR